MSSVVYFGSIPYNWDVETIKSVVCGTGRIVDVRCMMELPNKNKGFGFIEYLTPEEAMNAIPLLQQIRIQGAKRPRVELSKEGLRSGMSTKPVLQLNRDQLPSNVILPDEISRSVPPTGYGQGNILDQLPLEFVQLMTTNTQFQQVVTQMINNGFDLLKILELTKPFFNQQPQQTYTQQQQLPDFLKNASSYLPKEPTNLFKSDEIIDKSLQKFEPPLLIQLITNLKEVVDSSNSSNAVQVIKESPDLAIASLQLLLLMGFIDADVIQQAMEIPQAKPIDPNWVGFNQTTVDKLTKLDKSQADMIVQVLKMDPNQISMLPIDQRSMVEQLRSEYL